ncbi:hypothetical protein JCM11641_002755 [Rhodosporidiobolus odoratus]
MNGSVDLLSILRGDPQHAPLPPRRTPSTGSTSHYQTPPSSASSSLIDARHLPKVTTDASPAASDRDGNSAGTRGGDHHHQVDHLFKLFSQGKPNQQSQRGQSTAGAVVPGAFPAPSPSFTFPPPQSSSPTAPKNADGSAALLSLLHGMTSPAPSSASTAKPSTAKVGPDEEQAAETKPEQGLQSSKGGNVGELLASLMGGTLPAPAVTSPQTETNGAPGTSPVSPSSAFTTSTPNFSSPDAPSQPKFSFISPFDVLEKTHSAEKNQRQPSTSIPSSAAISPTASASSIPAALSSVPPRLLRHVTSLSSTSSSSVEDLPSISMALGKQQQPPSPLSTTFSPLASTSHLSHPQQQNLLATQYLTSSLSTLPSWAPLGLRLPRSSHPSSSPQILSIPPTEPHLDSLSPSLPQTTPITLMQLARSPSQPGARRTAAIWEGGIAYGVKGGRVRVIERESGGRLLIKPPASGEEGKGKKEKGGEKEKDEVLDLRSAPEVDAVGRRHMSVVYAKGGVGIWAVKEKFDEEDGKSSGTSSSAQALLVTIPLSASFARFHPRYNDEGKRVIAIVTREKGDVWLIDVGKLVGGAEEGGWMKAARKVQLGSSCIDLTFSPDGSLFALLLRDSYSVRSTATPDKELFSGPIPSPPAAPISTLNTPAAGSARTTPTLIPSSRSASAAAAFTSKPGMASTADQDEPSEITFLSPLPSSTAPLASATAHPVALAISTRRGTVIHLVPLSGPGALPAQAVTSIAFPSPPSPSTSSQADHHAQLAYHAETQGLIGSSAVRGSLFAFRLAFPPLSAQTSVDNVAQGTNEEYLAATLARIPANDANAIRVEWVLETPTSSGEVLGFVLDPLPAPASTSAAGGEGEEGGLPTAVSAAGKTSYEVLVSHPGGIDLVTLLAEKPRVYAVPPPADSPSPVGHGDLDAGEARGGEEELHGMGEEEEGDEWERAMAQGRRMSLEGSIYVESEVVVHVDERDDGWPEEYVGDMGASPEQALSGGGIGSRDGRATAPESSVPTCATAPSPEPRSVDEPALGDLGASGLPVTPNLAAALATAPSIAPSATSTAATPRSRQPSFVGRPPISPTGTAKSFTLQTPPQSPGAGGRRLSLTPLSQGSGQGIEEGMVGVGVVVRELRRIEGTMKKELGGVVRGEVERVATSSSPDSPTHQTAREETLLRLVVGAVKKEVAKVVDGVERVVQGTVREQLRGEIGQAVQGVLADILPHELSTHLARPDISFSLSASIATTIAPPLEASLLNSLLRTVLPSIESTLSAAVAACLEQIREEMLEVRKEIVVEQSKAVEVLEGEVQNLRGEVKGLKEMMSRMEAAFHLQQQGIVPASPRSQRSHVASFSHHTTDSTQAHLQAAAQSALPPIPRSPTPPERYEDLFTFALQPTHAPSFTPLVHLINASPSTRLDAVFPPPPDKPKLTPAVVLSLGFRLSEVLGDGEGELDEDGRRLLAWIRRAVGGVEGKQSSEVLLLIPRILNTILENLIKRGRKLVHLGDTSGAGEIRVLEGYARARLVLWETGGGKGPEGFRR